MDHQAKTVDDAFARFQASGDPDALAGVFDKLAPKLLRIASHLTEDQHVAEDLVQATFLVSIEKRKTFHGSSGVRSWLVGILTNLAREQRRKAGRNLSLERLGGAEDMIGEESDPEKEAETQELAQVVEDAIDRLPSAYRPVLRLHLREGVSAQTIAMVLERSPGTVRSQLHRGMTKLRAILPACITAGAVVLTTPVQGIAAMREVIRSKAAAKLAADSAASSSLVLGKLALWSASGVLAAAALILTISLNGGGQTSPAEVPSDAAGQVVAKTEFQMSPAIPLAIQAIPSPQPLPAVKASSASKAIGAEPILEINKPGATTPSMRQKSDLSLLPGAMVQMQSFLHSISGSTEGENLGVSSTGGVSAAGDVNNDGYADYIVGARGGSLDGGETEPGIARSLSHGTAVNPASNSL